MLYQLWIGGGKKKGEFKNKKEGKQVFVGFERCELEWKKVEHNKSGGNKMGRAMPGRGGKYTVHRGKSKMHDNTSKAGQKWGKK